MLKIKKLFKSTSGLIYTSFFLIILIIFCFVFPHETFEVIKNLSLSVRDIFGQFYLIIGFLFVLLMLFIGITPFGKIRLGNSKPDYSFWSWVAMLYSAGMGAGVLFRAVQEPVFMYQNNPIQGEIPSKIVALEYTFFQWGFTAWAFYTVFALIIGHVLFNKKDSVQLSNLFSKSMPNTFKTSINGLTILATITGIVSAVALGVKQIEDSANLMFDLPYSFDISILLVLIVYVLSTFSSILGLDRGIKIVSNLNIGLTTLLLIFIFVQSDMLVIIKTFSSALWQYIKNFVSLSLALGNYNPGKTFLTDWTYYYWAFWLAWAPFTGVFIARISKGRNYRQIIWGCVLVPSIASFFWFSVFGSTAIDMVNNQVVKTGDFNSAFTAISIFLNQFSGAFLTQIVVLILLFGFLITSLDSGIFVLSMFSDHGKQNPFNLHKLIWAILCFLLSIGLLYLGFVMPNQDVLSTVSKVLIIVSLPFAILSIFMITRFLKELFNRKNNKKTS
ncbi:BCCT family transporter [Psychroflexus sp. MBR-150]|jgi:glycine betaine transporter